MRSAIAIAVLLLTAAPASADDLNGVLGGLIEVRLRTGPPVTTHGADPAPPGTMRTTGSRAPVCADGERHAVLYGRPASAADGFADAMPLIESAVAGANAVLDRAAVESGDRHADLRVACTASGMLRVDRFVNPRGNSFGDVVDAARAAGAVDPRADYLIFYDDRSTTRCGVATFVNDDRPTADNGSNAGGGYAVVYPDCWEPTTVLHEVAHTQGAVAAGSPHATGAGHCRDESDVMCYQDGHQGSAGMLSACDREQFDCGYDDYFDAAPEPGEYLATHWNLGMPVNRFVEFSELRPEEDLAYVEPAVEQPEPRTRPRRRRGCRARGTCVKPRARRKAARRQSRAAARRGR